ncbi:T9SS type A sorting domain-containing protein [Epilithonimonas mollis]|uniref:Por secretion system C-terminal sorting domain-containing protein n=1 Tax=Epilithonimonas mollis TaxID=216903 RepID=A0A1M6TF06_9FLAO|nr:T9SS type A sorting domain-containing protein [Epilithonimonas mollis]SHK55577.1 Por secretion system C-terminal sorting domain-containing protein [Epilithonimonas mollis]
MKKIYLLSAIALSTTFLSAQVIESDNYNSYTLGDVGSNFAFGAPGQGGMYLSGGTAPDYQIVNIDATHDKSFQLTGGATATAASNRQAVKLGFGTAWAARTTGNDILRVTFDFYTGTSTGTNLPGVNVTNSTTGLVGLKYNTATKLFQGMANLTVNGTPAFYNITGISAVTYPANTWVKVGFTYDKVNGVITYTIDGVTTTLAIAGATVTKNLDGSQFNVLSNYNTGNTATTTSAVDNYVADAVNAATLGVVTVGQIEKTANVTVYPNPTADYINIKSTSRVISVNVIDVSGKSVASKKSADNQIDVRNLTKGTYIINVETENGTETKKFIKK